MKTSDEMFQVAWDSVSVFMTQRRCMVMAFLNIVRAIL